MLPMPVRLITTSQLSLFSISPVIGAWWQELEAIFLFKKCIPETSACLEDLSLPKCLVNAKFIALAKVVSRTAR